MTYKNLLACAFTGVITLVGANASATALLPFTVDEQSISKAFTPSFDADRISGNYTEVLTVTANTFAVSLLWQGTSFVYHNADISSSLNKISGYGLYALYQASGTVTNSDPDTLKFTFANGGQFTLFVDPTNTNDFSSGKPSSGSDTWVVSGTHTPIAQGDTISGKGSVDISGPCNFGCGHFNETSTLSLISPEGTSYFTAPSPFYNMVLDSGDIKDFKQNPTQTITGDMSITFTNSVPEPTSVALLGLGLLGVAASRRKSANSKNA